MGFKVSDGVIMDRIWLDYLAGFALFCVLLKVFVVVRVSMNKVRRETFVVHPDCLKTRKPVNGK